jgi:hypothetical protein
VQLQISEQPTLKIAEHPPRFSLMSLVPLSEHAAKAHYLAGDIIHLFPVPRLYLEGCRAIPRSFMECEPLAAYCNPKTYKAALESFKSRNECAEIGFYSLIVTQEGEADE